MKPKGSVVVYDDNEGIYEDRTKVESNVWDRQSEVVDTGILDPHGRLIKRRTRGMDPVGFIRFQETSSG